MNIFNFFYSLYENIYNYFYKSSEDKIFIGYISEEIKDFYKKENIACINKYVKINVNQYNIEELKIIFKNEIDKLEKKYYSLETKDYLIEDIEKITILKDFIKHIDNLLLNEDIKRDLAYDTIY